MVEFHTFEFMDTKKATGAWLLKDKFMFCNAIIYKLAAEIVLTLGSTIFQPQSLCQIIAFLTV